ncbi:MAG TPA: sigma-70 family RNA polymerase sigma factor [Longimicrobium sp.]|nr:sigma-70 family RNA polymerase sigma factor [Longimicrobium sp.]
MTDRPPAERLLLDHLPWIERACAALARRHGLAGDEADDFLSWARLRLLEDDCAILRKFRGECAATTYLTVVLATLFRNYRVREWGKWRPSAAAKREGPLAVRLEALVKRDGFRLEEAAQRLRTAGATTLSDRELAALLARLPEHAPSRPLAAGGGALSEAPAPGSADAAVLAEQAGARRGEAEAALRRAVERLAARDQVVFRMRFWEGLSVAQIARGLGVPQKGLYRRIERALARMRRDLERGGVSREQVRALLDEEAG